MNSGLKAQLPEMNITAAKEIEVCQKAILIFVLIPQLKSLQKIKAQLVCELEKKFSGKHIVFIAQRRILPKPILPKPTWKSCTKISKSIPGATL